MMRIKRLFTKTHTWQWKTISLFFLLFIIFLLNTFHEEYPDEYDNIVGGKYILEGRLQYRDWFSHHQPFPYIVSAAIMAVTGSSFVKFRIGYAVLLFVFHLGTYRYLQKNIRKMNSQFYLFFLTVLSVSLTFFWGHMNLADSLAAHIFVPAFALIFIKSFTSEEFTKRDMWTYGILSFVTLFTSLTYIYLVFAINVFAIYYFVYSGKREGVTNKIRRLFIAGFTQIAPYIAFLLYLLVSASLRDYIFDAITFNQKYYIYNYPGAEVTTNPIRLAVVIAHGALNKFYSALADIRYFNFQEPLEVTLALSQVGAIITALLKRRYVLLFPLGMALIYANARTDPSSINETHYQTSMYIVLSMFLGAFSLSALATSINKLTLNKVVQLITNTTLVALGVYWTFTSYFFAMKFSDKYFAKFMGTAPYIYDRPEIASIVNRIVPEDEYVWIGPLAFKELLYVHAKPASRYHWFLNHSTKSEKITSELISDLQINRPKLIVFDRYYAPWGGDPFEYNAFFREYLDANYFAIHDLSKDMQGEEYKWTMGRTQNFDIDGFFYFDRSRQDEILKTLLDLKYIERVEKT